MKKKHRKIWIALNTTMAILLILSILLITALRNGYAVMIGSNVVAPCVLGWYSVLISWIIYLVCDLGDKHVLLNISLSFVIMLMAMKFILFYSAFYIVPNVTSIYVKETDQTLIACEYEPRFGDSRDIGYIYEPIGCGIMKISTEYYAANHKATMFEKGYTKRWENHKLVIEIPTYKGEPNIIKTNIKK
ncbi:MAG: hypothetical protein PHT76_11305 [Anaerostipes sp.]|nr:hypothetical protein [Anaerostipes sp.]